MRGAILSYQDLVNKLQRHMRLHEEASVHLRNWRRTPAGLGTPDGGRHPEGERERPHNERAAMHSTFS